MPLEYWVPLPLEYWVPLPLEYWVPLPLEYWVPLPLEYWVPLAPRVLWMMSHRTGLNRSRPPPRKGKTHLSRRRTTGCATCTRTSRRPSR